MASRKKKTASADLTGIRTDTYDSYQLRTDTYDSYQQDNAADTTSTTPQPLSYNSAIYNSPTAGLRQPLLSQVIHLSREDTLNGDSSTVSSDDTNITQPPSTDSNANGSNAHQYTFVRRRPEDEWPIKYKLSDHAKSLLTDTAAKPNARKPSEAVIDDLDWLMLGISIVLLIAYLVLYFMQPDVDDQVGQITSNPLHQWIGAALSIIVVYYVSSFLELLLMHSLWLLNNTSLWKIYYYAQTVDSSIKWFMTMAYMYWLRHFSSLLRFSSDRTLQYLDPILMFVTLCLFAGIGRRFWVKLVTYRFNNGTYSQLIDEMYFKHNVLQRLANKTAYYQIVRPVQSEAPNSGGMRRSTSFATLAIQKTTNNDTLKIKPKQGSGFGQFFSKLGRLSHDNNTNIAAPIGSIHFSKKAKAVKLARAVFANVDRRKKGYIIASDLQNYLPEKTAIAAFDMLLTTLKELKLGAGTSTQDVDDTDDAGVTESTKAAPPTPFVLEKKKKTKKKAAGADSDSASAPDAETGPAASTAGLVTPNPDLSMSSHSVSFAPDTIGGLSPHDSPNMNSSSSTSLLLQFPSNLTGTSANTPSSRVPRALSLPVTAAEVDADVAPTINNKPVKAKKKAVLQKQTETNNSIDSIATFRLTEKQLNGIVLKYYKDYKKLVDTIKNTNGLSNVIDSLSQCVYWMGVMFALTIAFNEYIRQFAITISTVFFSLTFIFSQSLRDMFTAIIFLFYLKPYSVGDRVDVGTAKYRVVSIQLLTTTFRTLDQRITTVTNNQLASATVTNLSRSKNAIVRYSFSVAIDTTCATLAALRESVVQHINANSEHWSPNVSMHFAAVAPESNSLQISLWLKSKYLYTEVKALKRCKTEILHVVREAMLENEVTWTYPGIDIKMLDGPTVTDPVQAGNATVGGKSGGGGNSSAQSAAMLGSGTGMKMGKLGRMGKMGRTSQQQQQAQQQAQAQAQQQQQQQQQPGNIDDQMLGIS